MKTFLRPYSTIAPLVMLLALLFSCSKNDVNETPANPGTVKISFPTGSIPMTSFDSAKIIFTNAGVTREKKLVKGTSTMTVSIADLADGNWAAEFRIYVPKNANDQAGHIYIDTIAVTNPNSAEIKLNAPTGKLTDTWTDYLFLSTLTNEASILIAADNANPFFEIKVEDDTKWLYIHIDRTAKNKTGTTNPTVAGAMWECMANCYTSPKTIRNTTAFAGLANDLKNKAWNNTEIFIEVLANDPADDLVFLYNYDKK